MPFRPPTFPCIIFGFHDVPFITTSLLFFTGPRYYADKLHNALTCAAQYGVQNIIFVTITHPPDSHTAHALRGNTSLENDPITMTRVFQVTRQKVQADITAGLYCPPRSQRHASWGLNAHEWQSRALPHAHSIDQFPGTRSQKPSLHVPFSLSRDLSSRHIFSAGDLWTPSDVDAIQWTHIPTPAEESQFPGLTALVYKYMIHAHTPRCGGLTGSCKWHYPQAVIPHTYCDDTGHWHTFRDKNAAWVVPYNPALLLKLRSHACFIVISGTAAIGYLLQYGCKGVSYTFSHYTISDSITVSTHLPLPSSALLDFDIIPPSFVLVGNSTVAAAIAAARHPSTASTSVPVDEPMVFQTYRIINAPEAVFRILGYPLVTAYPSVTTLRIILPGSEHVYYNPLFHSGAEALEAYHTDPEKYFVRPPQFQQVLLFNTSKSVCTYFSHTSLRTSF